MDVLGMKERGVFNFSFNIVFNFVFKVEITGTRRQPVCERWELCATQLDVTSITCGRMCTVS
jgi:hypothetical protein